MKKKLAWIGRKGGPGGRNWCWTHPLIVGIVVRHCGHPTALRPYWIVGLPEERKFSILAKAQARAEEIVDTSFPEKRRLDGEWFAGQFADLDAKSLWGAAA